MLRLRRAASLLERITFPASRQVSHLGEAVLIGMMLFVVTDVVLRRLFNRPMAYSFEVIEFMLAFVVFFSVAYCATEKGHVSIDILVSRFSPKAQATINAITYLLSVGLFGLMGWRSLVQGMHLWEIGQVTGILKIPLYPSVFAVALGSILLGLVLLVQFLDFVIVALRK